MNCILHYLLCDELFLIMVMINSEYVQYLHLLECAVHSPYICIQVITELLLLNIILEFMLLECQYYKWVQSSKILGY